MGRIRLVAETALTQTEQPAAAARRATPRTGFAAIATMGRPRMAFPVGRIRIRRQDAAADKRRSSSERRAPHWRIFAETAQRRSFLTFLKTVVRAVSEPTEPFRTFMDQTAPRDRILRGAVLRAAQIFGCRSAQDWRGAEKCVIMKHNLL